MVGESRLWGAAGACAALLVGVLAGAAGCGNQGGAAGSAGAGGFTGIGGNGLGGSGGSVPGTAGSGGTGAGIAGDTGVGGMGGSPPMVTELGDAQTPPMGAVNVKAWLATGQYKTWRCEGGPHPPHAPSTHGTSRACSNKVLSGAGPGEFPVGSAGVIELYDNVSQVRGYGVSRHVAAGSDPSTWYWYSDLEGVFFGDGLGYGTCSTCHQGAGTYGSTGHDYVFIQVK